MKKDIGCGTIIFIFLFFYAILNEVAKEDYGQGFFAFLFIVFALILIVLYINFLKTHG